ncbi:hypothetical protein [Arthrobacter sp. RAF14]|uniref:hypothetical protein n=1 Tax=Arthrobacter sp. RAF14 TaxID=3233051 RepID=UPI003F8E1A55
MKASPECGRHVHAVSADLIARGIQRREAQENAPLPCEWAPMAEQPEMRTSST